MSLSKDRIHAWRVKSAIDRCHNPSSVMYRHYGGRGITVFPAWRESPVLFELYLEALPGYFPGAHMDRIDNNRGYEPGNIRWVTHTENQRNRRDSVLVRYLGMMVNFSAAMDMAGLSSYAKADGRYLVAVCGASPQSVFDHLLDSHEVAKRNRSLGPVPGFEVPEEAYGDTGSPVPVVRSGR